MTKEIKLMVSTDKDGVISLIDQEGRRLSGVRYIEVDASYREATVVTVQFLPVDSSGNKYANLYNKKGMFSSWTHALGRFKSKLIKDKKTTLLQDIYDD